MMQQGRHDDGTATGQYNFKYNNYNGNYSQNKLKTKELYEKQVSLGEKPSLFLRACAGLLLIFKNKFRKTVMFRILVFYVPVWIPKKPEVNATFQN